MSMAYITDRDTKTHTHTHTHTHTPLCQQFDDLPSFFFPGIAKVKHKGRGKWLSVGCCFHPHHLVFIRGVHREEGDACVFVCVKFKEGGPAVLELFLFVWVWVCVCVCMCVFVNEDSEY